MNIVFMCLIVMGIIAAIYSGDIQTVTTSLATSSGLAIKRLISLTGIVCVWMGISKVAEKAGLMQAIAVLMQPFFRLIFPSVPANHPAMGLMLMNFGANILGLGSAATPFGLKAMCELQKLNRNKSRASDAMCTFLVVNSSGITLIPATIIAIRAVAGSKDPTIIVGSTMIANIISTGTAIFLDFLIRKISRTRGA